MSRAIAWTALAALVGLAIACVTEAADAPAAGTERQIAADYAAITDQAAGQTAEGFGTLGSVPVFGRASFPVLTDSSGVPVMAAGRLGDGAKPSAARMVAGAHTGFFDVRPGNAKSRLFLNAILWASRHERPGETTVGLAGDKCAAFLQAAGFRVKPILVPAADRTNLVLTGCDVVVLNLHEPLPADALKRLGGFVGGGGGLVVASTPWALKPAELARAQKMLEPFGLAFGTVTAGGESFPVAGSPPPSLASAGIALDALLADAEGGGRLSLADKKLACTTIDRTLAARPGLAVLEERLDKLHRIHDWISPTRARPLEEARDPVRRLVVRYQSTLLDRLSNKDLFVHPAARELPGLPPAGADRVTRTIAIDGDAPVSKYMQSPDRPTRVETGLYAGPGDEITITLPRDKAGAGLLVHIGGTEDDIFSRPKWDRFPKLWRRVALDKPKITTGHALGGLVTLLVPPGAALGRFEVTLANVLPTPSFTLGEDDEGDWRSIRGRPAPWGFVRTPKLVIYVSREQLAATDDIGAVARHWDAVMNLADDHYGYGPFRRRAEVVATGRQVSAGAAYAQYPIELGWGVDEQTELAAAVTRGNWGTYHELGHTFQADFANAFVIPTHAEVDVNLLPGMAYTLIHDRTAWDGETHGTFDGPKRLKDRLDFLAQDESARTWKNACGRTTGYDFYFNLAEAFGWRAYRTALTRLMRSLQGERDAELDALDDKSPNFKRDRFYLLMCTATGHDLDRYFQRYGLGVPGRGAEITPAVKAAVAARRLPEWIDNRPPEPLPPQKDVALADDVRVGATIATIAASDPEPGTIFTYEITSGNDDGSFAIGRRTGVVTLEKLARGVSASRTLTVTCHDNGVPRHSQGVTFTVSIGAAARDKAR